MSRVIEDPQEERRVIPVDNPNHFKRDTTNKTIKLVNQAKQYGLVFDKRVIDPDTKILDTEYGQSAIKKMWTFY